MDTALPAKEAIQSIVACDLVPALKLARFKKSGLTFTRRLGSTAHFLQIQLSRWNQGSDGGFYVNVGVMFDQMRLTGDTPPVHPKYGDCQFMTRLERLVPTAPVQWSVDANTSVPEVAKRLADNLKGIVETLNSVSSLTDFDNTGWIKAIPWGFPAQYAYALGRDDEVANLIASEAAYFAERGATRESLRERYGLTRLQC